MDIEDFDTVIADEAADYLQSLATGQQPDPTECMRCYLERMVGAYGCDDSTRFTRRWLEAAGLPDPDVIAGWLEAGGGYCDCEVVANSLPDHWPWPPLRAVG